MTDYTKLVEALRCREYKPECGSSDCPYWSGLGCMDGQLMEDAADAIEALQADQKKTVTQIFGEEQIAWEGLCKDLMYQIADLQAQLSKRGEWIYKPKDAIEMMFTLPKCSVCGHESSDANNFCPNCGAKMEETEDEVHSDI